MPPYVAHVPVATTAHALGEGYAFTGRADRNGQQVRTVGRLVLAGNHGWLVLAAAPDRADVADDLAKAATSLKPPA